MAANLKIRPPMLNMRRRPANHDGIAKRTETVKKKRKLRDECPVLLARGRVLCDVVVSLTGVPREEIAAALWARRNEARSINDDQRNAADVLIYAAREFQVERRHIAAGIDPERFHGQPQKCWKDRVARAKVRNPAEALRIIKDAVEEALIGAGLPVVDESAQISFEPPLVELTVQQVVRGAAIVAGCPRYAVLTGRIPGLRELAIRAAYIRGSNAEQIAHTFNASVSQVHWLANRPLAPGDVQLLAQIQRAAENVAAGKAQ